jgi:hypothetical protein
MSTSYSTSLKLALPATGDQSGVWGVTTNNNIGTLIEQAITGVVAINASSLGGSSYTLTNYNGTADDARNAVLVITGSPGSGVTIIAPLVNKLYTVANLTGQTITMSASGGSQTLAIPANSSVPCFCDAYNATGTGTGFYAGLTGVAGNFAVQGDITATGNITGFYSSDAKFKENIQPIENALDTVRSIGGDTFDWTDEWLEEQGGEDGYFYQKSDFGVVAQKVQKVFPRAVRTRPDGSLAVDYEKLSALAFAAIDDLAKQVEELKLLIKE